MKGLIKQKCLQGPGQVCGDEWVHAIVDSCEFLGQFLQTFLQDFLYEKYFYMARKISQTSLHKPLRY